ncbi:MAG: 3'-5' exonuclease [bacterium]
MKLLFLDTETSGVNHLSDQIIEIGAVVVELDPATLRITEVSEFESLLALRQTLDDKITRITGISTQDLAHAPNLSEVQENWANWLEPISKDIVAIVGHSIQFDISFLQTESWFLPQDLKVIDTLDLSRILYPQLQAVNLEFLAEKLELINFKSGSSYHRSLFDSKAAYKLFENILSQLKSAQADQEFYHYLKNHFLPLELEFYSKSSIQIDSNPDDSSTQIEPQKLEITLKGEVKKPSQHEKIQQLGNAQFNQAILELFQTTLPEHLASIVASIYFLNLSKAKNPQFFYKLHNHGGSKDYLFVEIVLDLVLNRDDAQTTLSHFVPAPLSGSNLERQNATPPLAKGVGGNLSYFLPRVESVIWRIKDIAEDSFNLGTLIEYAEFLRQILAQNTESQKTEIFGLLTKLLSENDFLIFALQPYWQNNSYFYRPKNLPLQEKVVGDKIQSLFQIIDNIKLILESGENKSSNINILQALENKILQNTQGLKFSATTDSNIYFAQNQLIFSKEKSGFYLDQHFRDIQAKFPGIEFKTSLTQEGFESFKKLAKIDITPSSFSTKEEDFEYLDRVNLNDFYQEKMSLALRAEKSIIILGGLNSTLKDSKNILVENYTTDKYLILGETGSLTKVASKLVRDFKGLAILKFNNLEFILNLSPKPEFLEIWMINQPYFFIHKYWLFEGAKTNDKQQFSAELKRLYLQSHIYYFLNKYQVKLKYIRGY